LVSGYLEKAVAELVLAHARYVGGPSLQRFVEQRTRTFTNANTQKLYALIGDFDPSWRVALEGYVADERKAAVDSVVALRNQIAHGKSVGVTYQTIRADYARVQEVVDFIADMCDPA
jgi:hypothetical protein